MEDQLKKTVKCVRAMLALDNVNVSAKKIAELISSEDLSDVNVLVAKVKGMLENDMRSDGSNRRNDIESFIINNWEAVKSNETVRTALLNAYSKGRYSKDKQKEMRKELLEKVESTTSKPTPTREDKGKSKAKYDFQIKSSYSLKDKIFQYEKINGSIPLQELNIGKANVRI